ncbi:hypothetical protein PC110_g1366 [Phytophthora cactorum]|uniref:Uncharacterized protein n=1 Tax=Phytophthora cactorum TaxID=29920 RepID=A0A329T2Z9_9STRA|nr:hypothetical protein PC110_g1366 [Phytophthora cactorum]
MGHLRVMYRGLVVAIGEPWLANEATRRVFISQILTTCVAAVKGDDKTKQSMFLDVKKQINVIAADTYDTAAFIVTFGTRMIIVTEAENKDEEEKERKDDCILGICTDYQNWIFVKRTSTELATKHMVCRTHKTLNVDPLDFPLDMIPIANKVYIMLKLL